MSERRGNFHLKHLKLLGLYGTIIIGFYTLNKYLSDALLQIRSSFEHIPIWVVWPFYMLVNIVRVSLIIPYYVLPLGSFIMWYFMVTLGVETASIVLIWSWVLQVVLYVALMRKLWTSRIESILGSEKDMWWFPNALRRAILAADLWWKDWAKPTDENGESRSRTVIKQGALVYLMETTWFVGGIVPEVWISTRTVIPMWIFSPSATVAYWLLYPWLKTMGRAMVEVTSEKRGNLMQEFILRNIEGLNMLKWWEVLFAIVLPLASTLFVHGQHIRILVQWVRLWCRGELVTKMEPKSEQENIELHPKEEIEKDLLNDRTSLPSSCVSPTTKGSEIKLLDHWEEPVEVRKE